MPWADEAEQQFSRLTPAGYQLSADVCIFGVGLRKEPGRDTRSRIPLKFKLARKANSSSLCASIRAVPWADEAEQQLSRLAPSACKLSADVHIFRAGLPEAHDTVPLNYV